MNKIPRLSIVFLNYNRLAETRYTLAHLQNLISQRSDVEVIAVDNGSSDGTPEFLQTQTHWISAIYLPTNLGIDGYNEGFKQACGEYLLVLDDDSHPLDNLTLDRLITHLDTQPQIGVVACRIETPQGQPVLTWHLPQEDKAGYSIAFVGCGFAIRRTLLMELGGYPAEFFLYQNEIEVAIQVMRRHYSIYYDPACRVVHRQSPTGRSHWRQVYYPTRNTIWLIRRYFPFPSAYYLIASRLCFGFIRALQSREFKYYYRAVTEALTKQIEFEELSPEIYQQLTIFWRQNSVWHQLIHRLKRFIN
ncbi:MAG: glycosyltransferase [Beggiatoa sp. IS2]|nr:MAG: glycosyltransferase [Beggiatoa sp. IS2]